MSSSGIAVPEALRRRRELSAGNLAALKRHLGNASGLCQGKACVYATGSYGRAEASEHSDLDLFIVSAWPADTDKSPRFGRLDEICVKADLIAATKSVGIREFDKDGKYLQRHDVKSLVDTMGKPQDDAENTFTARLLLLLESVPLIESDVYDQVLEAIVEPYWRDFENHRDDFLPAYIVNDILRLWRTFCVNYEVGTLSAGDKDRAKRRIKNLKLKHSRMLTCFSTIACLLDRHGRVGTVSPADMIDFAKRSPTMRLEALAKESTAVAPHVHQLLDLYAGFLDATNGREEDIIQRFLEETALSGIRARSYAFGDAMFDLIQHVASDKRFRRLVTV